MPSFLPSTQDDDNRSASTAKLINCYRQAVPGGERTQHVLKSVLGTEAFADVGNVFFYGAHVMEDQIFTAVGGRLYRINAAGASTDLGAVTNGQTDISANNGVLAVAAAGSYFTVTGGVIASPTLSTITSIGSVDFADQYTVYTEKDGRRWGWSALADATSMPALNFATAEATDDSLLRVIYLNGRVILFKGTGREVWYNTGASDADAFTRMAGGVRNIGLKAFNLITRTDEALFWVGNDNICRITLDGLSEQKLAYPPVETAIRYGQPTECFYYEDEGEKFCVIRFADRPSWCFGIGSGEWHQRAEGASHTAWSLRGTVKLAGVWRGFTDGGLVRSLTRNNADVDGVLKRTAVSPTFVLPGRNGCNVKFLELYTRTGYSDLGRDAQMWIRVSRDGGQTWSREKWQSLGTIGDHGKRAKWPPQGHAKNFTIEANISDPAELPLWADFDMEIMQGQR